MGDRRQPSSPPPGTVKPEPPPALPPKRHDCDGTNIAISASGRQYCAHCGWNDPEAEDAALAQFLIELAFIVKPGTDVGPETSFGKSLAAYVAEVRAGGRA